MSAYCTIPVFIVLFACQFGVCGAVPQQRDQSQLRTGGRGRDLQSGRHGLRSQTCVPLVDRISYMVVAVGVGTPPQPVELVVDSGSSMVVVVGCGGDRQEHCYEPEASTTHEDGAGLRVVSTYGKGSVHSTVGTDVVRVGSTEASLDQSLLEATSFEDFDSDFQGILGLGPSAKDKHGERKLWSKLFMEEAGIGRYSICFSVGAGAIWMDALLPASPPLSILPGSFWALNLAGVSAGNVPSSFCTAADPCTVISDSGSTGVYVPEGHLEPLFETLCDAWPRCIEEATTSGLEKYKTFFSLIYLCDSWLSENGLDELPSLSFLVQGSNGMSQKLTLSPWAYVEERAGNGDIGRSSGHDSQDSVSASQSYMDGMLSQYSHPGREHHGPSKVCWPSFNEMPSGTHMSNTWLLGTVLFYEYAVHFDISTTPASLAFEAGSCGGCGASPANLRASSGGDRRSNRPMRHLDGPPRLFGREFVTPEA